MSLDTSKGNVTAKTVLSLSIPGSDSVNSVQNRHRDNLRRGCGSGIDETFEVQSYNQNLDDVASRLSIMFNEELHYHPRHAYIEAVQRDGMQIVWRSKVATWLLEFEDEFGISQNTIAIAINYMDRYLSMRSMKLNSLQLLAMASIFVATKLYETQRISLVELRDLADRTYSDTDIKAMEMDLICVIKWQLNPVVAQGIMSHLLEFVECALTRAVLFEDAVTFLDVVLPEYSFLKYRPSTVATASILAAFETTCTDPKEWIVRAEQFRVFNDVVFECKQKMQNAFYCLCPNMAPQNRGDIVVSPTCVEDLYENLSFRPVNQKKK